MAHRIAVMCIVSGRCSQRAQGNGRVAIQKGTKYDHPPALEYEVDRLEHLADV